MMVVDHITLNINNNMSMTAVFLDIEKAFDTTWHSGLLYKLSELEFSRSVTNSKFEVLVEVEIATPRKIAVGVPQGTVLALILYSLYINDASASPGNHHVLFADDTCIYATERHERRVFCNCNEDSLQ
jgi:hypothetical protein